MAVRAGRLNWAPPAGCPNVAPQNRMLVSESCLASNLVASSPSWKMDLPPIPPHVPSLHPSSAAGKKICICKKNSNRFICIFLGD